MSENQTSIRRTGYGLFALGLAESFGGLASKVSNAVSIVRDGATNEIEQISIGSIGSSVCNWTDTGLVIAGMVTLAASAVIVTYTSLPSQRNYTENLEGGLR